MIIIVVLDDYSFGVGWL